MSKILNRVYLRMYVNWITETIFRGGEVIHFIWLVWILVIDYQEALCDTNIAFQHHRIHGLFQVSISESHHCVFDCELKRRFNLVSASFSFFCLFKIQVCKLYFRHCHCKHITPRQYGRKYIDVENHITGGGGGKN